MFEASPLIGREVERRRVLDLLSSRRAAPFVIHVQGMPGIGKSALLDELAADARALGHAVHAVARELPAVARAHAVSERLAPVGRRTVLVVDDWDALAIQAPQLVDRLERVTGPLVLLLGSRQRPDPCLLDGAMFPDRLEVIELGGLSEAESVGLLRRRGLPAAEARRVHRACGGQPFAMLLAAAMPGAGGLAADQGAPREPRDEGTAVDIVRRIVGHIDDPRQIEALELLSLAGNLNERELRVALGLGSEEARTIFERLRALTIVCTSESGLALVDLVRAAFVADLKLRDPIRARAHVARLLPLIEESLVWRGRPRSRAIAQLCALVANAPQDPAFAKQFELGNARVAQARERELGAALELVEALEGAESRAIAARFVAHDPTSIAVLHGVTGIDAVLIRVELRGQTVPPALREPALSRLVEVLTRTGELTPSRLLRVTRFFVAREHHQRPCYELGALCAVMSQRTLETHEPFLSAMFFESGALDAWRVHMDALFHVAREDAAAVVGGRRLVPCLWTNPDVGEGLVGIAQSSWGVLAAPARDEDPRGAIAGGVEAGGAAMRADDLEAEIVRALGHLRDLVWLRGSPLGALLFAGVEERERAARLQAWLHDAIAATGDMRRGDLVARSLRACFEATRSVDESAAIARMSPSTLKRYRRLGISRIVELARQRGA